jgi:hypothetical protein
MAEPDELYTLRQQFYVGNFQVRPISDRGNPSEGREVCQVECFRLNFVPLLDDPVHRASR